MQLADILSTYAHQRANLLTQLKRQGLPLAQLQQVFDSIILARLLCAAPALRGYLSSTDINCLQQFLDKAKDGTLPLVITALMNCLINVTLLCLNHR